MGRGIIIRATKSVVRRPVLCHRASTSGYTIERLEGKSFLEMRSAPSAMRGGGLPPPRKVSPAAKGKRFLEMRSAPSAMRGGGLPHPRKVSPAAMGFPGRIPQKPNQRTASPPDTTNKRRKDSGNIKSSRMAPGRDLPERPATADLGFFGVLDRLLASVRFFAFRSSWAARQRSATRMRRLFINALFVNPVKATAVATIFTLCLLLSHPVCAENASAAENAESTEADKPSVSKAEHRLLEKVREKAQSDPAAAIRMIKPRIKKNSSAALPFTLGSLHLRQNAYEKAADAFRAALDRKPGFLQARRALAQSLVQEGNDQRAAAQYRKLLQQDRAHKRRYWTPLGRLYLRQNRPAAAETAFRNALALRPGHEPTRQGLLQALLRQNRQSEAQWFIRRQLSRHPQQEQLWKVLAQQQLENDDSRKALVLLECARRTNAAGTEMLLSCADLYARLNLPTAALQTYQKAAKDNLKETGTKRLLNAAEAFIARGLPQKAAELLATIKEKGRPRTDAQNAKAAYLAGVAAAETDSPKQAFQHFKNVLTYNALHGPALLHLGRMHIEQGRLDRATSAFRRATHVEAHRAKAYVGLARVAVARKDYNKAIERLKKSLSIESDPSVKRYLQSLKEVEK